MKRVVLVLCVLVNTLGVVIIGGLLWVFVRPWNRPLQRSLFSRYGLGRWLEAFTYLMGPPALVCYGDYPNLHYAKAQQGRPLAMMICNHQVDLDWLYLFEFTRAYQAHSSLKVVLKETLKFVPLIGQAMVLLEFLFLRRSWETDRKRVASLLNSFVKDRIPLLLLIFPEGTTVHEEAVAKSKAFAKTHSRPDLDLLILPRTTGFQACLNAMQGHQPLIYDVTMAYRGYSGEIPSYKLGYDRENDVQIPNMGKVLKGLDTEIHLDVRACTQQEIDQAGGVEAWLDARWVRKEALLKYFIRHQKFPEEAGAGRKMRVKGSLQSLIELWLVVISSGIILPFALMLFIPYVLVFAFTYSYLMYHDYTRGMLSREEDRTAHRTTVMNSVFRGFAMLFLIATVVAWLFTTYILVTNFLGINLQQLWS